MQYLIRKINSVAMMLEALSDEQKAEFVKRFNVEQITLNITQLSNQLHNSIGVIKNVVPDTEPNSKVEDQSQNSIEQ